MSDTLDAFLSEEMNKAQRAFEEANKKAEGLVSDIKILRLALEAILEDDPAASAESKRLAAFALHATDHK